MRSRKKLSTEFRMSHMTKEQAWQRNWTNSLRKPWVRKCLLWIHLKVKVFFIFNMDVYWSLMKFHFSSYSAATSGQPDVRLRESDSGEHWQRRSYWRAGGVACAHVEGVALRPRRTPGSTHEAILVPHCNGPTLCMPISLGDTPSRF